MRHQRAVVTYARKNSRVSDAEIAGSTIRLLPFGERLYQLLGVRMLIVMSLLHSPALLIADEPTSALVPGESEGARRSVPSPAQRGAVAPNRSGWLPSRAH